MCKLIKTSALAVICIAFLALGTAAQETQSQLASKTAKFSTIATTDPAFPPSLDAHDLKAAKQLVGMDESFIGLVTKVFTPKSGAIVILNFDKDYKTALTAVIKRADWAKFPDLTKLQAKRIRVSGKFVDFRGATEIDLTDPGQIKIVE